MPSPISTRVIAPKYPMFFDHKKKEELVELPDDVEFNCDISVGEQETKTIGLQNSEVPGVIIEEPEPYAEVNIENTQTPVFEVPVTEPEPINPVESTIAEDHEAAILTEKEGLPDTQENVASDVEVVSEEPVEVVEEIKPVKVGRAKSKKK